MCPILKYHTSGTVKVKTMKVEIELSLVVQNIHLNLNKLKNKRFSDYLETIRMTDRRTYVRTYGHVDTYNPPTLLSRDI